MEPEQPLDPEPPGWEQFMRCEVPCWRPLLYTRVPPWRDLQPKWRRDVIEAMRRRGIVKDT